MVTGCDGSMIAFPGGGAFRVMTPLDSATRGVTLASVPAAVSGTDLVRIPLLDPPLRTDHPRIAR